MGEPSIIADKKVSGHQYWAFGEDYPFWRRRRDLVRFLGRCSDLLAEGSSAETDVLRVRLDAFARAVEGTSDVWTCPFAHAGNDGEAAVDSGLFDGSAKLIDFDRCRGGQDLNLLREVYLWSLYESYRGVLAAKDRERFVVTVWGQISSGKSTLINTLFGTQLPVADAECTMVPARIRFDERAGDRVLVKLVRTNRATLEGLLAYARAHAIFIFENDKIKTRHYIERLECVIHGEGADGFFRKQAEEAEKWEREFEGFLNNDSCQLKGDIFAAKADFCAEELEQRVRWIRENTPPDSNDMQEPWWLEKLKRNAPLSLENWLSKNVGTSAFQDASNLSGDLVYQAADIVLSPKTVSEPVRNLLRGGTDLRLADLTIVDLPGYNTTKNVHARYYSDAMTASADAVICVARAKDERGTTIAHLNAFVDLFRRIRGLKTEPMPVVLVPTFACQGVTGHRILPSWTAYNRFFKDLGEELVTDDRVKFGFCVPEDMLHDLPGGDHFTPADVEAALDGGPLADFLDYFKEVCKGDSGRFGLLKKALLNFFQGAATPRLEDGRAMMEETHRSFSQGPEQIIRHLISFHQQARSLKDGVRTRVRQDLPKLIEGFIGLRARRRYRSLSSYEEVANTDEQAFKGILKELLLAKDSAEVSQWLSALERSLGDMLADFCENEANASLSNHEFRGRLRDLLVRDLPELFATIDGLRDRQQFHAPLALALAVTLQQTMDTRLPIRMRYEHLMAIVDYTFREIPTLLDSLSRLFEVAEEELESHPDFLVFRHDRELRMSVEGGGSA